MKKQKYKVTDDVKNQQVKMQEALNKAIEKGCSNKYQLTDFGDSLLVMRVEREDLIEYQSSCHWSSGIVTLWRPKGEDYIFGLKDAELCYSSGGTVDCDPRMLAQAMICIYEMVEEDLRNIDNA